MTPGEIHGLHKQVVDDLKAQLAAAREEARNERTRAEAAEQELRDERDNATVLSGACRAMQDKLAAIRAHLQYISMADLEKAIRMRLNVWLDSKVFAAAREALEP